ncbi:MAG: heterodisulfide reductase subunit E, partial [Nitrospirota bacterium]
WESPYPLTDPLKMLGNFSGILLLLGITLVVTNRFKNKEKADIGSYFDWLFITVVAVVAVTGMLSQFLRLADISVLAYPVYFTHLVSVFFLFLYAPYSKFAHLAYRTTAMVYAKHSDREVEVQSK